MAGSPQTNTIPTALAQNDAEAAQRFSSFGTNDPFRNIFPALLNSADIYDYVIATGMLYPFNIEGLKPASYEVDLLGDCVIWDESGKKQEKYINRGDEFILPKNSIAFVQVEPKVRLPDYIAIRFNLKITHVYRGLLLGTGPLVDPGFEGPLYIPIHNLTTNEYRLRGGEGLIWMEFTKISHNLLWLRSPNHTRVGEYSSFPDEKKNKPVSYYLNKADPHRPIRSSIPEAIYNAEAAANQASAYAQTIQRRINIVTLGGVIAASALIITLLAYAVQVTSLTNDSISYVNDAKGDLSILRGQIEGILREREEDKIIIESLSQEVQELRNQLQVTATPAP